MIGIGGAHIPSAVPYQEPNAQSDQAAPRGYQAGQPETRQAQFEAQQAQQAEVQGQQAQRKAHRQQQPQHEQSVSPMIRQESRPEALRTQPVAEARLNDMDPEGRAPDSKKSSKRKSEKIENAAEGSQIDADAALLTGALPRGRHHYALNQLRRFENGERQSPTGADQCGRIGRGSVWSAERKYWVWEWLRVNLLGDPKLQSKTSAATGRKNPKCRTSIPCGLEEPDEEFGFSCRPNSWRV